MSKNEIDVDILPLIQRWAGYSQSNFTGTHSGGDLNDLRVLLDKLFGHGGSDIIPRMKLFGKTFITKPYRHNPKSDVQEFKVIQGDIIETALATVPFPLSNCN